MSYIVFFSYAKENWDRYLEGFLKDLREEIAPNTEWAWDDERITFRDKDNLHLMEKWEPGIENALQSSAVLVCITSVAYLNKPFCGKEYYLFDQRRRQGVPAGQAPPAVILPVIWAPVPNGLPDYMNEVQQMDGAIADAYRSFGLRHFKRFEKQEFESQVYNQCVTAFARAISAAWKKYPKIKPLAEVKEFRDIPNKFAGGDWQEAASPAGWLPGPEVANFVFAAPSSEEVPAPPGRYGSVPSEWRPYLPPETVTIKEHARTASQSFKLREIPLDDLADEIKGAKERKNLTLLVADPKAFLAKPEPLKALEKNWWEGTGAIFSCEETTEQLRAAFNVEFPILISRLENPDVPAPARSGKELRQKLEETLHHLRIAVTQSETGKKDNTDTGPPVVNVAKPSGEDAAARAKAVGGMTP